jgi:hypothetical protein
VRATARDQPLEVDLAALDGDPDSGRPCLYVNVGVAGGPLLEPARSRSRERPENAGALWPAARAVDPRLG